MVIETAASRSLKGGQRASVMRPGPLTKLDWAGVAFYAAVLLLLAYLRSRNTMFWSDEVMGWLVLHEKTFPLLLHSWQAGLDSSGIFFYIFGRPWVKAFGDREIALRMFSAAGVAGSCVVLWLCARRFFRIGVVAAVLPVVYLWNPVMVWQLANARSYGLFLCAIALVAYAFALTDPDKPTTGRLLVLTFLAHLLLLGSHILGLLYSGVFLMGLVARDLWFRTFRWKLYLSVVASWSMLLLSWKNIQATSALGKPSFWTIKPHLHDLGLGFTDFDVSLRRICIVLAICVFASYMSLRGAGLRDPLVPRGKKTLYALIATFAACVLVMFAISRVTTSVYVDRYLLPVLLGAGLALCEMATLLLDWWKPGKYARIALVIAGAIFAAYAVREAKHMHTIYPEKDYTARLAASIPSGVPAVITNGGVFVEMVHYRNQEVRLLTPVDWSIALDPMAGPGGVSGAHEMDNWKSIGYYSDQIQPTSQILAENKSFLLMSDDEHTLWFHRYVEANPHFVVSDLGEWPAGFASLHVWLVRRK